MYMYVHVSTMLSHVCTGVLSSPVTVQVGRIPDGIIMAAERPPAGRGRRRPGARPVHDWSAAADGPGTRHGPRAVDSELGGLPHRRMGPSMTVGREASESGPG